MEEVRRRFLVNTLKVFDVALVTLSFWIATIVVAYSDKRVSLAEFLSIRVRLSNCLIFATLLLVWHALFRACGLYRSKRSSTIEAGLVEASKAVALSTACLALGAALVPIAMVTAPFLILFWAVGTVFIGISRVAFRRTLDKILRRGRNIRHVLIVGTNFRAIEFARKIEAEPERGYRILGFADDDWPEMFEFVMSGYQLVCSYAQLPEFLRRNVVDEVAMYLPLRTFYHRASEVARLCEQHGILMRFDGDIFSLKKEGVVRKEPDEEYYLGDQHAVLAWWPMVLKRLLDIVFASLLLFLIAPFLVAIAVLIRVTSDGPAFYLQERVGLNKRRFLMYKFRTMIPNAEKMIEQLEQFNEVSGPVFKIKDDPRITPIGKILRRASIDEVPQLLNVLKGDMSLVGPRPLPVRDYEGFNEDWQRRRFSVRPGITCLWQIKGRSSLSFNQWMNLDLQYLDEWSLWLDLKILIMTIPAVLKGTGAA